MDTPEIATVAGRLGQAVNHPLRIGFLRLLANRPNLSSDEALARVNERSLDEFKEGGDVALSQVDYHLRVLERFGVVELASRPYCGRYASFRTTPTGRLLMLAIEASPGGS